MTHIMVIDDEPMIRDVLMQTLTSRGYTVTLCACGKEALDHLQRTPPDIVITDLLLPDYDGLEIIKNLQSSWPHVPIIAISGGFRAGNIDILEAAAESGAAMTMAKPVSVKTILQAIETTLEKRRPQQ